MSTLFFCLRYSLNNQPPRRPPQCSKRKKTFLPGCSHKRNDSNFIHLCIHMHEHTYAWCIFCFSYGRSHKSVAIQCQEALDKCRSNKGIMSETNRGQLGVLQEMSSWCLQDLGTKMNRTKIETLVTIQVHAPAIQRGHGILNGAD